MNRRLCLFVFCCIFCPAFAAPAQKPAPAPNLLAQLAGEYTDPVEPDTPLSVYHEGDKLWVESERAVPRQLKPEKRLEFHAAESSDVFRFSLNAAGNGETLTVSSDPIGAVHRRTGPPVRHLFHDYRRSEVMIPMRDGVKLHAVILQPADISAPLPFLIERTPYGVDGTTRAAFFGEHPELARASYIFVAEDIRGRYKSRGKFIMMRPLADHRDPKAVD